MTLNRLERVGEAFRVLCALEAKSLVVRHGRRVHDDPASAARAPDVAPGAPGRQAEDVRSLRPGHVSNTGACRTGALPVVVAHRCGILTPHQCNKMFKEGKLAACFKTATAVGEAHLVQAEALGRAFQEAIAPATVNYDFGHIRDAAAMLPDSDIVTMVRGWGLQEEAPIAVMALSLKEAVRQALPPEAAQASFWDIVERDLVDAFTGLAAQEGEPGLAYYEVGPDRTSYYRDLFFALQDEEAGPHLYAVAFCTDVTIGFGKSRVGTLGLTDTAPFAVRLNAIVVRQKLANVA